jgi:hypothetical protein
MAKFVHFAGGSGGAFILSYTKLPIILPSFLPPQAYIETAKTNPDTTDEELLRMAEE